jgi:hypothetical protein
VAGASEVSAQEARTEIMSWTNFTLNAVEIRTAISDDGGFIGRVVSATNADGQASIPRFARGSNEVYVSWRRFPFPGTFFGYGNVTAFARSSDGGLTWEAPIELSPEFITQDQILGNDRSTTSPSMAVDRTDGPRRGTIYIVYPNNNSLDGSDIVFQKSTDGGITFSAPLLLNSRPGQDRARWFPWITVDDVTGRVSVFYYDQGIATSGHLSEVTYLFSNDGGASWESPRPLTDRPFKAGHGNDTSQPNLGDYNQAVARSGRVWVRVCRGRPPAARVRGWPAARGDDGARRRRERGLPARASHPACAGQPGHADRVDAGRARGSGRDLYAATAALQLRDEPPLRAGYRLRARVPHHEDGRRGGRRSARVVSGAGAGADAGELACVPGAAPAPVRTGPADRIPACRADQPRRGAAEAHALHGHAETTTLLEENFEAVPPGSLPAGWTAVHGAGARTVLWTTSNSFCGGVSNGAFNENADTPTPRTRWERLLGPVFAVPPDAEYVVVEFDVCYDTEEDPVLPTTGYDGFFLRITDLTPGRTLRSVLVEAFEDEFTTGGISHYPRHFPRSSNPAYFQDMSAWSGNYNGLRRVRLRLPGMAGSVAQLRFEYTQDSIFSCTVSRPSPQCGVFVDNVTVKSVVSKARK